MKKNLLLAALLMAGACTGQNEIDSRIESLESRVTALETQVQALNKNVAAVSALMEAGTIYSVAESDGVWTITLSDGRELKLTQGSIGVGSIPVMTVDAEGYWMVDYGSGPEYVLSNGSKVMAAGADGVTPQFGVNSAGNWTVSYDGGQSFQEVKAADGQPVSALPGTGNTEDQFFQSVSYEDGVFTLVLKNGTKLTVPVVAGFRVVIDGAGDLQVFTAGETRTFPVTLEGTAQTILTAPQGWAVSLTENILSITAPVTTKAALADTRTDVSILALSASGFAAVAKVKVTLDDTPHVVVNPTAAIIEVETGITSISFGVVLSDASAWKYLVREASAAAPSAEYVFESGIIGEGSSATVTGLTEGTSYTIYVLPINGDVAGTLSKADATTLSAVINDFYQAWEEGKDIEIAGVKYNKASQGAATLLTAETAATDLRASIHQKSGVFFLEQADGADFVIPSVTEITGDVILMSRYADNPVTVRPAMCTKLKSGSLILKNLVYDMVDINGGTNAAYAFNNANATADFTAWHFEGCRIVNVERAILYANVAGYGFRSLIVKDCDIQLTNTANIQLFNFYRSTVLNTFKQLVFENNVVFNVSASPVQIMNYDQNISQTGSPWEGTLSVKNNLFYNCPSANGYFKFYELASLKLTGNIFWADPAANMASYCFILYSSSQTVDALEVKDNIAYGLDGSKNWIVAHGNSTVKPESNTIAKEAGNPLRSFDTITGAFELNPSYESYGPKR